MCILTWDNTFLSLSPNQNYNSISVDTTNTYASDIPIDKNFYDYGDDQYRDFHKNNTGKDMIGYIYPSKLIFQGKPKGLVLMI